MTRVANAHKKELLEIEAHVDATIRAMAPRLGMKATLDQCLALVEEAETNTAEMLWYPKHSIERDFFTNVTAPDWNRYPPHTRIGIDVKGHLPAGLEYRLLEASLFESSALLWNDTVAAEVHDRATPRDGKLPTKRYRELQRSTIRAIFALIEGYLNGIAYDIELTTDLSCLSVGAREAILERTDDGKARFKTLREKIFAYPRIALGLEHSPVSETQADVAWILEKEKELRDAIVHPTPRAEQHRALIREQVYYDTELPVIGDFIDHAIGLIRHIDGILNGKFGRVDLWIRNRGADGKFSNETFH